MKKQYHREGSIYSTFAKYYTDIDEWGVYAQVGLFTEGRSYRLTENRKTIYVTCTNTGPYLPDKIYPYQYVSFKVSESQEEKELVQNCT